MNGKKNRPLIIRLANEGNILGHRMSKSVNQYPESAVAVENAEICLITSHHFRMLMDECADFRNQIINIYLEEMKMIEGRAVHLVHKNVREKIACVLLHIADIYKYKPRSAGINIHLSRQDIADLSATTKEQVSKTLKDFMKEKMISFRAKHFKFFDREKLREAACINQ
jgi:CRP/FNR family transcriptional regulator